MAGNAGNPASGAGRRILPIAGSLEEVNTYFYEHGWTDGLPIVPPTRERVETLLAGWTDDRMRRSRKFLR